MEMIVPMAQRSNNNAALLTGQGTAADGGRGRAKVVLRLAPAFPNIGRTDKGGGR